LPFGSGFLRRYDVMKLKQCPIMLLIAGVMIGFPAIGLAKTPGLTFDRYVNEPSDDAVETL
jgi:hypothetical protein